LEPILLKREGEKGGNPIASELVDLGVRAGIPLDSRVRELSWV